MADDFVLALGGHGVQAYRESFILLVGNKVDFGAKDLSNQGTSLIEAFDFLAGQLCEGCFSPITVGSSRPRPPDLGRPRTDFSIGETPDTPPPLLQSVQDDSH